MLKVENTQAKRVKAKLVSRRYQLSLSEKTGGAEREPGGRRMFLLHMLPFGI